MQKYTVVDSETATLQALYAFTYLTAEQVTRLLFSPGSRKSAVNPLLKRLADREEVHRVPMFTQLQSGSAPYVYWLATKGRNRLKKLGYDFTNWRNPSEMHTFIKSSHFAHSMVATDFLIEATLVSNTQPAIQLLSIMHDFTLKRLRNASVIPDGLMHFVLPDGKNLYLVLEVDLDTEKAVRFKEKITRWMTYISEGGFARDYGITDAPLLIFYSYKGEHRVGEMVTFIEDVLHGSHEEQKAVWFRVGCGQLSPDMFFEERWYQPDCEGKPRMAKSIMA